MLGDALIVKLQHQSAAGIEHALDQLVRLGRLRE
jgi:hypothetical protein